MTTLIRSKGFVWLSNSHPQMFTWALAGKHFELKQYATWWDSVQRDEWPQDEKEVTEIMKDFDSEVRVSVTRIRVPPGAASMHVRRPFVRTAVRVRARRVAAGRLPPLFV